MFFICQTTLPDSLLSRRQMAAKSNIMNDQRKRQQLVLTKQLFSNKSEKVPMRHYREKIFQIMAYLL
jgi:hypothetical protein